MEEINKEEINRYLSDKICPNTTHWGTIDLFSPEGFFILWNFSIEQDWWEDFLEETKFGDPLFDCRVSVDIINPEVLPIEVYNYLRRET